MALSFWDFFSAGVYQHKACTASFFRSSQDHIPYYTPNKSTFNTYRPCGWALWPGDPREWEPHTKTSPKWVSLSSWPPSPLWEALPLLEKEPAGSFPSYPNPIPRAKEEALPSQVLTLQKPCTTLMGACHTLVHPTHMTACSHTFTHTLRACWPPQRETCLFFCPSLCHLPTLCPWQFCPPLYRTFTQWRVTSWEGMFSEERVCQRKHRTP